MSPFHHPFKEIKRIPVSSRLSLLSFVTMEVTSHTAYVPIHPFSGDVDVGVGESMDGRVQTFIIGLVHQAFHRGKKKIVEHIHHFNCPVSYLPGGVDR